MLSHDVEFDETNGSQEEDENLDDVRGTQLVNAMKNMDIGDIRPREVIDVEDDKNQVLSNSNEQASGSQDQSQTSASVDKVQDQLQVASSSSQPNDQSNASISTNQCCKRLSFGLYNWLYLKRCAN